MPLPGHPQVPQDAADTPLVLWRLFVDLRILQNLLQHVRRLNGAQQTVLLLDNRIQPLGDVTGPMVGRELEPKNPMVLQRVDGEAIKM